MFQDSILYLISCNEDPNASPNRKKRNAYSVGLNDNCQGTVNCEENILGRYIRECVIHHFPIPPNNTLPFINDNLYQRDKI